MDSGGLKDTKTVRLDPDTVSITLASIPSRLQVVFNGTIASTPFSRTVIRGSTNTIGAPSPQTLAGTQYSFMAWSDGGGQNHNITANTAATYTATYSGPPVNVSRPTISGEAREGRTLTTSAGSWETAAPVTFAYQWLRCDKQGANCVVIAGATSTTYTATSGDVGSRLRAKVTATNSAGSSSATSDPTAAVKRGR
jgi:hypothetical protein